MSRRAAVFLDRDGVLNQSRVVDGVPTPPRVPADLRILPGVAEACAAFRAAGALMIVVTNQPDVSRGTLDPADLSQMNRELQEALDIDEVVVCPHDDAEGCPCRKPRPGMILDAARRWDVDLNRSVCVGDRWRDVEAAQRAGVHAVLIDWGHPERVATQPDAVFGTLIQAVDHVLDRVAH